MIKHRKESFLVGLTLTIFVVLSVLFASFYPPKKVAGAEFPKSSQIPNTFASTTAKTLTWGASTPLLATSSRASATATIPETNGRSGFTLQTVNCALGGEVWIQFNDVPAATTTGIWMTGSTTRTFSQDFPSVQGGIRAISSSANCTILITEYRSQP